MSLFSLGRYKTVFLSRWHPSNNFCCSETLTDLNSHLTSSVSAGCRGGLLLCAISAFTRKIKFKLFEALAKQEIGFFETVKTGKTLFRALRLRVNIEKDDTEGQRGSTELKMNTKEIKMQMYMDWVGCSNVAFTFCAGQLTSRLSEDTVLMARTVCLNANVMLRTFIRTMGTIYFMMSLSWKLTFLVLMETPVTAVLQKVYSAYDQVKMGREG